MAFDVISIGDSVIDTVIPLIDPEVLKKHGNKHISFRLGDKVPVGPSVSMVAGNAANNAVGSSRLNLKTAIYTNVGNLGDEKDDLRIINKFKDEKVDTRYIVENHHLPSNHNVILDYQGERTILVYHQPWKYNLPDLEKTKWVYFTSLSPNFIETNIVSQLVNYLERSGARLLFNPGTFQVKLGVKKNARLLSLTQLLVVNTEEAKLILGHNSEAEYPIKKLLKELVDMGVKMSVITDGKQGSFGFDGEKYYKMAIFPAKLVEMTGAGDAYGSGVLAALAHGNSLPEAMRWGSCNSAAVVEKIGAQAGLLSLNQMQERLKENSAITAKEI